MNWPVFSGCLFGSSSAACIMWLTGTQAHVALISGCVGLVGGYLIVVVYLRLRGK